MILLFLAALAASPAAAKPAAACPDLVTTAAFVCRALAADKAGRADAAAEAFEQAAAASGDESERARLLAAAGNMWIAAGQAGKAALALDRALPGTGLRAEQRGEALLDRARAAEMQGDLKTARARVAQAAQTISGDPFLWYFSAALAIREGDAATAKTAIGRALALAPGDATVLFEAGHVHAFAGDFDGARLYFGNAARADPNGAIGKAAREAIALLPAVKPAAAAPR